MFLGMFRKLSKVLNQLKLFNNHNQIYVAESYKYLGTIIIPSLKLGLQFAKAYKQMSTKLKLIRKLKYYLNAATKQILISLIQPTIKYNCLPNLNFTKTQKEKLKHVGKASRKHSW